jgi:hypothetical protein
LFAALLCRHSQFEVQQADDASHIGSSTRLGNFTQPLTNYQVVRYGITLACFPNKETVDRAERQIARQQEQE